MEKLGNILYMKQSSEKLLILEENERQALGNYCAKTTVGFFSLSDHSFYATGILTTIQDAVVILTAAHVINNIERYSDCKIIFPFKNPSVVVKDYSKILTRVSNSRQSRDWNAAELDIGVIIPPALLFDGVKGFSPIDLSIGNPIKYNFSASTALIFGFPLRFQAQARKNKVLVSHIVYTQIIKSLPCTRENDYTISNLKIWNITSKKYEEVPDVGGMSGGPIYSYIREPIEGVWIPEKQIILSGMLHFQKPDEKCILGHCRQTIKDFLYLQVNGWGRDEFCSALEKGFKISKA